MNTIYGQPQAQGQGLGHQPHRRPPQPPLPQGDVYPKYQLALAEIETKPNADQIVHLLDLANENRSNSNLVLDAIFDTTNLLSPDNRVGPLYVLDAIMKNLGRRKNSPHRWIQPATERLIDIVNKTYSQATMKETRTSLSKLVRIWGESPPMFAPHIMERFVLINNRKDNNDDDDSNTSINKNNVSSYNQNNNYNRHSNNYNQNNSNQNQNNSNIRYNSSSSNNNNFNNNNYKRPLPPSNAFEQKKPRPNAPLRNNYQNVPPLPNVNNMSGYGATSPIPPPPAPAVDNYSFPSSTSFPSYSTYSSSSSSSSSSPFSSSPAPPTSLPPAPSPSMPVSLLPLPSSLSLSPDLSPVILALMSEMQSRSHLIPLMNRLILSLDENNTQQGLNVEECITTLYKAIEDETAAEAVAEAERRIKEKQAQEAEARRIYEEQFVVVPLKDLRISSHLNNRDDRVVESLYSRMKEQCKTCGFRTRVPDALSKHMDAHFKFNEREKRRANASGGKGAQYWYCTTDEWVTQDDVLEVMTKQEDEKQEEAEKDKQEVESFVPIQAGEDKICSICHELFSSSWSDEADSWLIRSARLVQMHEIQQKYVVLKAQLQAIENAASSSSSSSSSSSALLDIERASLLKSLSSVEVELTYLSPHDGQIVHTACAKALTEPKKHDPETEPNMTAATGIAGEMMTTTTEEAILASSEGSQATTTTDPKPNEKEVTTFHAP